MNSPGGTHAPATANLRNTRRQRRRWCGLGGGRGRGAPSTPLLHWTFYNANKKQHHHSSSSRAGAGRNRPVELSARKLAAGLWQLRRSTEMIRCRNGGFGSKYISLSDRSRYGLQSLLPHSKSVIEEATKWDSRCSATSINIEAYCFLSHLKLLQDQFRVLVSFMSGLPAEHLEQAQSYIHDLESKLHSSRKHVRYLQRKLGEQKEHYKVYALIDDLRGQLTRERKKRRKMEILNSHLVKEIAEAKLAAKQLDEKYETERRKRELMDQVCKQLAKKIGEDKAELEALRIETMEIREEMEQERKMLQMAEVLREERVQMKLSDAKLALESKYSEMNKLIIILENFLRSRSGSMDVTELKNAQLIAEAVKSVSDIQDIEPCFNCSSNGDVSDNDHVPKNSRDSPNAEVHEEWSISGQQSKLKTSSNGGVLGLGGTFASPWTIFPIRKSVGRIRHQRYSMGQWGVKDMVNPHIARGIKGCIESSRGFQKNITVKAKLWEARIDSEKAELQTD